MEQKVHWKYPYVYSRNRYGHLVKGARVEVTSRAEGFVGSWFEATVIKPPELPKSKFKRKRATLVEYSNLVNEEGTLLLRELVDVVMIRPTPPSTGWDGGFEVGDLVDTFDRDGWWTGFVERVIREEGKEERYVVSFEKPVHEIEFGREQLRLHLDWMDGKWLLFRNGKGQVKASSHLSCTICPLRSGFVVL